MTPLRDTTTAVAHPVVVGCCSWNMDVVVIIKQLCRRCFSGGDVAFFFCFCFTVQLLLLLSCMFILLQLSLALPQRIVRYFVIAIALLLFCLLIGVASVVFVFAV